MDPLNPQVWTPPEPVPGQPGGASGPAPAGPSWVPPSAVPGGSDPTGQAQQPTGQVWQPTGPAQQPTGPAQQPGTQAPFGYPGPSYGPASYGGGYGYEVPPAVATPGGPYRSGPPYAYQPDPAGPQPPSGQHRRPLSVLAVVLALLVSALFGYEVANHLHSSTAALSPVVPSTGPVVPNAPATAPAFGGFGGNATAPASSAPSAQSAAVAAKVNVGVVDINTVLGYQHGTAAGTGMVITASGEVLTNNHVVEGATSISVRLVSTGKTYPATVVGTDVSDDVALIQLTGASGLQTVSTGDSSKVAAGDPVVAIGNAGGTGGAPSVVEGTVEALGQNITASDNVSSHSEQLTGLIQTSAPLQPGDSGGPLASTAGKVIGMDTAASATYSFSQSSGQSFAIPINTALALAKQMESGQASAKVHIGSNAFLGVQVVSSPTAGSQGAVVQTVVPATPAAKAGLQANDTITQINGQAISSPADLTALLLSHHPGDKVTVQWVDSAGQPRSASITLASGPVA